MKSESIRRKKDIGGASLIGVEFRVNAGCDRPARGSASRSAQKTTADQTDSGTSLRSSLPKGVSRKCSGVVSSVTPMLARARSGLYSALASA
jgi:hypothetical protein